MIIKFRMGSIRKVLIVFSKIVGYGLQLSGAVTFQYSTKRSELVESRWAKYYCGFVALVSPLGMAPFIENLMENAASRKENFLLTFIYVLRAMAFYVTYLITVELHFWKRKKLMRLLNELIAIAHIVKSMQIRESIFNRTFFLSILVEVVATIIRLVTSYFQATSQNGDESLDDFDSETSSSYSNLQLAFICSVHVGLIFISNLFKVLNEVLVVKFEELEHIQVHQSHVEEQKWKRVRIKNDIEFLIEIYFRLYSVVEQLVIFFQWQILITTINLMVGTVTKCFTVFSPHSTCHLHYSLLFLSTLEFVDFFLIAVASDVLVKKVALLRETLRTAMIFNEGGEKLERMVSITLSILVELE